MSTKPGVGPSDIWKARARLKPHVDRTPLIFSAALSRRLDCQIYLKMECWQRCGCFKVRGAINLISALTPEQMRPGLVTASSGNHALATAYAASLCGAPQTHVFLPQTADPTRIEKIRRYPVEIVFHGTTYVEAYDRARQFCEDRGAVYVHSHGDPRIIAGQGTIGLEILEDLPEVEAVLVPIGGGGLMAGIATALKPASLGVGLIGVEPTAAPSAYMSLRDGRCYERIETKPSLADGLLGGIGLLPFEVMRQAVDQVALVEEAEIGRAVAVFQKDEQLMVEPAAAVGLAALMSGQLHLQGKQVVLVVTSRNIDSAKYNQIIATYG